MERIDTCFPFSFVLFFLIINSVLKNGSYERAEIFYFFMANTNKGKSYIVVLSTIDLNRRQIVRYIIGMLSNIKIVAAHLARYSIGNAFKLKNVKDMFNT